MTSVLTLLYTSNEWELHEIQLLCAHNKILLDYLVEVKMSLV